jgi:hypothetical protein
LGHDLLELLLLLLVIPEAVLLLIIPLDIVVLLDVVILVGGVELLPLGAVDDEVGGVTVFEAAPRLSPPQLAELVQGTKLSRQQGDLVIEMLSYCSSEATPKEDKTNSKADETIVLVGLALVIKDLLVKEAS